MHPILELKSIRKSYGDRSILQELSLSIRPGEFFSLLGPSGCGKSTILRIIAGFDQADSGQVWSQGRDITQVSARQRDCNMVFQNYALFPHMTVFRNVAFGLEMKKLPPDAIQREVDAVLDLVQMRPYAQRLPHQLSGGQQQRVALARAIAPKPSLLLLDEPLGALDLKLRRDMQLELKHLQRRLNIAFIFVTHDQDEAMSLSDRLAIMDQGRILQLGTPQEIYDSPVSKAVASFLGEADFFACEIRKEGDRIEGYCAESGCTLPLYNDRDWRAGDQGLVPVRPEQWEIAAAGTGVLQGSIEEWVYRGRDCSLIVRLPSGRLVQVLCAVDSRWQVGQRVSLNLRGEALRALPTGERA